MDFNKKVKLIAAGMFGCMLVAGTISYYTYYDFKNSEAERLIIAEEALEKQEQQKNETLAAQEEINAAEQEFFDIVGLPEEFIEGSSETTFLITKEELESASEGKKFLFDLDPSKEPLTESNVNTYYNVLTQYVFANNFTEAGKLANLIMSQYNLNDINHERLQRLILDVNFIYTLFAEDIESGLLQSLDFTGEDKEYILDYISEYAFSLRSPEVFFYVLTNMSIDKQLKYVKDPNSIIISQSLHPSIEDIQSVSAVKHKGDLFFAGSSRYDCFELKVKTDVGSLFVYVVQDHNFEFHLLTTENIDMKSFSTYDDYNILYN